MNEWQYRKVCTKYGLVIDDSSSRLEAYFPMLTKEECDSLADFDSFNEEAQYYCGFSVNFDYPEEKMKISFHEADVDETKESAEFECVIKHLMDRYNLILPLIKKEKMQQKLNKIKKDF